MTKVVGRREEDESDGDATAMMTGQDETVTVTKSNITMYGDGSQKSMITGSKNFADGVQTYRTATVGKCI